MKKVMKALPIALAVMACTACTTSQPAKETAAQTTAALETAAPTEAAKEETVAEKVPEEVAGNLMVYTSADDKLISEICIRFNEKYPNAHAEYYRSGAEEVVSKLMAEKMTSSIQADIVMISDIVTMEMFKSNDMLMAYDSPEIDNVTIDFVDAERMYYGTFPTAMGLCYNTNLVTEPITSWNDLLEEFAKDNAIMPSPLYSGTACYALQEITRAEGLGWEYYQGLCDNGITVVNGNGGVVNAVSAGEKAYGIVNESACLTAVHKGSPIAFVYPEEGVPSTCDPVAILNTTQNIPAAQAFVDFMLSKEVQELGRDILGQTPTRSDVELGEGSMPLKDRTLMITDPKELEQGKEADKEKFAEMFDM